MNSNLQDTFAMPPAWRVESTTIRGKATYAKGFALQARPGGAYLQVKALIWYDPFADSWRAQGKCPAFGGEALSRVRAQFEGVTFTSPVAAACAVEMAFAAEGRTP